MPSLRVSLLLLLAVQLILAAGISLSVPGGRLAEEYLIRIIKEGRENIDSRVKSGTIVVVQY